MKPLWTESEALVRAMVLVAQFDRDPDVFSPDEQALCMAIKMLEQASNAKFRQFVEQMLNEFIKKSGPLPPAGKPA